MRSVLQLTGAFIFLVISGIAQDITPKDADSLSGALDRAIPVKDRISALLQLAEYNAHQRKAGEALLKEAGDYLHEAEQLSRSTPYPWFTEQRLIIQSVLFKVRGDTSAGRSALEKAIGLLQTTPNKALLGKAYYEMSEFYSGSFLHATMLQRIKYLQLAITAFQQTDHLVELARCYRFLADLHQMLNDNRSAFSEIRTALKYYDQAGYSDKQGAVSLLGRIYYEGGDYQQALRNELLALRIATSSRQDNVSLICQINNNIGYTYLKLDESEKALQYFRNALNIAEQEKDTATTYLLAANVVDAYIGMNAPLKAVRFFQDITRQNPQPVSLIYEGGDYGISHTWLKIYMALRQYDKARVYCDYLIKQAANPNINLYTLTLYYQLIARFYTETGDHEKARYYLNKDKELVTSLRSFSGMAHNYRLWFSLDSADRRYEEAIADLINENVAKDSIFDETKSRQIAQLEIEFETEKKENQISLLNQKAILEETRLKEADTMRNVTIGGILLSLIIAGLLYRQSSLRKKYNVLTTQKNELLQDLLKEKEWLLKEVHHRVKNNLHTVMGLLRSQARFLEDDALKAIEASEHRIYTMSLIHQRLYQSDNIGDIDTRIYLKELTTYLSESFGAPSNIRMQVMVDDVKLKLPQAIPLSLIINEAITNAFKYAFPDKRPGQIILELRLDGGYIKTTIADDGIGMPSVDIARPSQSLGLSLMRGLTGDLEGDIRFENNAGTRITVTFPFA